MQLDYSALLFLLIDEGRLSSVVSMVVTRIQSLTESYQLSLYCIQISSQSEARA